MSEYMTPSMVDALIKNLEGCKGETLTDGEVKQLLNSVSESEVNPKLYAELHPESVIIKKHNKELADGCKFKPTSKNCEYKNYWEKCAFCKKELSR